MTKGPTFLTVNLLEVSAVDSDLPSVVAETDEQARDEDPDIPALMSASESESEGELDEGPDMRALVSEGDLDEAELDQLYKTTRFAGKLFNVCHACAALTIRRRRPVELIDELLVLDGNHRVRALLELANSVTDCPDVLE